MGYLKVPAAAKYADVGEKTLRAWLSMGLKHSLMPSVSGKKTSARYALIKIIDLERFVDSFKINHDPAPAKGQNSPIDQSADADKILAKVFSAS